MSVSLNTIDVAERRKGTDQRNASRAFIIESLVLLVFIAVSVALLMQLFTSAMSQEQQAHRLNDSTILAQNTAEAFAANPQNVSRVAYYDANATRVSAEDSSGYTVITNVTGEDTSAGTLYKADITVLQASTQTYDLSTQRYFSNTSTSTSANANANASTSTNTNANGGAAQ